MTYMTLCRRGGGWSLIWKNCSALCKGGSLRMWGFCRFPCWFVSLHFYIESCCAAGISEGYLGQQRQDLLTLNLNDEDWTQCWSESLDTACGQTISKYFLAVISEQQIHLGAGFFLLQRSYEEINREASARILCAFKLHLKIYVLQSFSGHPHPPPFREKIRNH